MGLWGGSPAWCQSSGRGKRGGEQARKSLPPQLVPPQSSLCYIPGYPCGPVLSRTTKGHLAREDCDRAVGGVSGEQISSPSVMTELSNDGVVLAHL